MEALLNKKSAPEEFFAGLARQEKVEALRVFWKLKMQGISHSTFWRNRAYCGLARGQSPASSVSPSRERQIRLPVRQDALYGLDTHWMVTGRLCNSCRKKPARQLNPTEFCNHRIFQCRLVKSNHSGALSCSSWHKVWGLSPAMYYLWRFTQLSVCHILMVQERCRGDCPQAVAAPPEWLRWKCAASTCWKLWLAWPLNPWYKRNYAYEPG